MRELADAAHDLAGGPLDVLVNNAAMLIAPGPTEDVDEAVIDDALAVNVKAAFLLTGLIAPRMAARGKGAIVNVGSINGLVGMAHSALYSATKAAVHSLTKSWAAEYWIRWTWCHIPPGFVIRRRRVDRASASRPLRLHCASPESCPGLTLQREADD